MKFLEIFREKYHYQPKEYDSGTGHIISWHKPKEKLPKKEQFIYDVIWYFIFPMVGFGLFMCFFGGLLGCSLLSCFIGGAMFQFIMRVFIYFGCKIGDLF